jgi:2-polyprenyl-3-methyl-5-hydroxy-6-metoxy-1,4-benzoquinol methylase
MKEYEAKYYGKYASVVQQSGSTLDVHAAKKLGTNYDFYFRGWMPQSKGARILDLGCGSGQLMYFFLQRGYNDVTGVDASGEQVALARQVSPRVQQVDALSYLSGCKESLDLITALDLIEHLEKDAILRLIEACHLALHPGGRLAVQLPNGNSPFVGEIFCGDFTHQTCLTPGSLAAVLRLCDFKDITAREACPAPAMGSPLRTFRWLLWQFVRAGVVLYNLLETGRTGDRVLTRVFLMSAIKA